MNEAKNQQLFDQAVAVLHGNDRGDYIMPAADLYPHQWLWDSCFIAIGLRHLDIGRAQKELESLMAGQWSSGMLPHIIFDSHPSHHRDHNLWQSWLNPHAPNGVITSGITQPPLLAEAIVRIGQKLKMAERRSWYARMYPHLLAYHQWFYADRAIAGGLVAIVHPYESGLDNSPPLMHELREHAWPWWLKLVEASRLDTLVGLVRRDVRRVPASQRINNAEALAEWALLRRLRTQGYDSRRILQKPKFGLMDLAFNCIFIRANHHLREIAKTIGKELPAGLAASMKQTESALADLCDEQTGYYYGRCISGDAVYEATIATLLPLYAGCISQARAERLADMLGKRSQFKSNFPVASVPLNSHSFNPINYWQGPAWVNMNWLIIDGLNRYGFKEEAEKLRQKTLKMIESGGCYEYFNPLDGTPLGADNFSWTAALSIDLLQH